MVGLISILLALIIEQGNYFDLQLKKYLDKNLKSFIKYEYQVVKMPKSYTKIEINSEKTFRLNKNYGYVPVEIFKNNSVSQTFLVVKLRLYQNIFFLQKISVKAKILQAICSSKTQRHF